MNESIGPAKETQTDPLFAVETSDDCAGIRAELETDRAFACEYLSEAMRHAHEPGALPAALTALRQVVDAVGGIGAIVRAGGGSRPSTYSASFPNENPKPKQMVRSPVFWVMYGMFICVAAGGIVATAQIGPIAKEYGFASRPVSVFGVTLPLQTVTLSINNLCNGVHATSVRLYLRQDRP